MISCVAAEICDRPSGCQLPNEMMLPPSTRRLAQGAAVAWLIAIGAVGVAQAQETAAPSRAQAIIEKALTASDPASALDGEVDLSDRELLEGLRKGLESVRRKHGPAKTIAFSSRLVEAAGKTGDDAVLAGMLSQHAQVIELAGDYNHSTAKREEAALIYDRLGKPGEAALCRNDVGSMILDQGRLTVAADVLRKSREAGWPHWSPKHRLRALLRDGVLARELGRPRDAIRIQEEALGIARQSGDKVDEARVLNNLSVIHLNTAEYRKSLEFAEASFGLRPPDDHQGAACP